MEKHFNIKFGERLKNLRMDRYSGDPIGFSYCKTQESFAEKLKVQRFTVNNWENDKNLPTIKMLMEICEVLVCHPNYLLGYSSLYSETVSSISKEIGLSEKSILRIKKNSFLQHLVNYFIDKDEDYKLLKTIEQFALTEYVSSSIFLTSYNEKLRNKIESAFHIFSIRTHPLDKNIDSFKECLKKEIPFISNLYNNESELTFDEYLKYNLSEDVYLQFSLISETSNSEEEKYELFINDIALRTYDILERNYSKDFRINKILQSISILIAKLPYK